jgi:hypothetical protein
MRFEPFRRDAFADAGGFSYRVLGLEGWHPFDGRISEPFRATFTSGFTAGFPFADSRIFDRVNDLMRFNLSSAIGNTCRQDVANFIWTMEAVQVTRDSEKPGMDALASFRTGVEQFAQEPRVRCLVQSRTTSSFLGFLLCSGAVLARTRSS